MSMGNEKTTKDSEWEDAKQVNRYGPDIGVNLGNGIWTLIAFRVEKGRCLLENVAEGALP
jgi:hypothetical protein